MRMLFRIAIALLIILCCTVPDLEARRKTKSLCDVHFPSDSRIEWDCLKLKWTDIPQGLFGEYWQDVLRFNRMDRRHFFGGISIKVPKRLDDIKGYTPLPASFPDAA